MHVTARSVHGCDRARGRVRAGAGPVTRLLLLGGGHAHLQVLQAIAREPIAGARVLLVSPFARQIYSGMVPGFVAGHYAEQDCAMALAPLAQAAGAHFVEASAVGLDAHARKVTLSDGRIAECDVLSIDTGPVIDADAISGARDHGLFVRPLERFVQRLDLLLALAGQRALDVVVIGGGAAGVELSMAFAHRLRGVGDGASRVALVTGGAPPLAGYADGAMWRALRALRGCGVTVLQETCVAVEAAHVVLGNGARVASDASVLAIGASAPRWLAGSGLALDAQGFVATGPTLQSTSHPTVFAAGDVATRIDSPHLRSGVHAVRAGAALARNLRCFMAGAGLRTYRPPTTTLNLVSCGDRRAIASWGAWSAEGRWVWQWKDRIDRAFVASHAPVNGQPAQT